MLSARTFLYAFCTFAFIITGGWSSNKTAEVAQPTPPNEAPATKCLVCSSNPDHKTLFDVDCRNPSPEFLKTSTKIIDCSQYRSRVPQGASGISTECPSVRLTRCASVYYETFSNFKSMDSKTYDWSGSKSLVFRFCACASPALEKKIQDSGPNKKYCNDIRGVKATSRSCICQPKSDKLPCNAGGQIGPMFQALCILNLLIPFLL